MPQIKSMEKRLRQSEKRHYRNVGRKKAIKSALKDTLAVAQSGDEQAKQAALSATFKALDKAAQRNVIPKQRAARKKSRLTKQLAKT